MIARFRFACFECLSTVLVLPQCLRVSGGVGGLISRFFAKVWPLLPSPVDGIIRILTGGYRATPCYTTFLQLLMPVEMARRARRAPAAMLCNRETP